MSWQKRVFDLLIVLILLPVAVPMLLVLVLVVLILDGRPVFYPSERMRSFDQGFTLWKFRTMRQATENTGVTGGDKSNRITRSGTFMRKFRLDELPQFLNVLRGDISLVGPRPPLRIYVEAAPDIYKRVLKSRPGITGLATLVYHSHESGILASCKTAQETHDAYLRRCVPAKAKLDLIYQSQSTVCFDAFILARTIAAVIS